jgi:HEAT repeat protein
MPLGDLAGKPLLVDPEVFLMGSVEYKDKLSADDFMALYRNAPNAAAKARLDDDHISVLSGEQVKRLADEEKNVDLRIRLLGHVQDEAYLLNLARTDGAQDPRLLNALTSVPPDRKISDEAVAWLRETFEQNQNPVIRQNALHSILAREKDDALAERAWQMPSYNDQFRIIALDYFARTAPDRAREMALGVMAHPDSEKLRVHAIGMLGRLKDKPGDRRVFNALVKVVQERSFNARRDAINALAAYGDKAAVPFIEPVTTHSLHFMRRTAQAAVARLKGK